MHQYTSYSIDTGQIAEVTKQCNEHLDFLKKTKVKFELQDGLAVTQ